MLLLLFTILLPACGHWVAHCIKLLLLARGAQAGIITHLRLLLHWMTVEPKYSWSRSVRLRCVWLLPPLNGRHVLRLQLFEYGVARRDITAEMWLLSLGCLLVIVLIRLLHCGRARGWAGRNVYAFRRFHQVARVALALPLRDLWMHSSQIKHVVVPHFRAGNLARHHLMMRLLVVRYRGHVLLRLLLTVSLSFFRFLLVWPSHAKSLCSAHIILLASTLIDIHCPLGEWNIVEFLLVFICRFDVLL